MRSCIWLSLLLLAGALAQAAPVPVPTAGRELRVCADPNNLPFSNDRGEGFENRLAQLLAKDLHATVRYTFWAQRRGFLRNTLKAGLCDVVMGLPAKMEMAATTRPYYRSTYVFVTQRDRALKLTSWDDPRLKAMKVGVQIVGADHADSPPGHALADRGIVDNVVGFTVFGDYAKPNPPAAIVQAVERGEVDVAIAWGPMASYFARRAKTALAIAPVPLDAGPQAQPFAFDIAVGVRKGDPLKDELDAALDRNRMAITRLLDEYAVPQLAVSGAATGDRR